jgi:hypothetical protein
MLCSPHGRLHSASPKNVLGPIRAALRSRSHFVNLKNVPRPIRSELRSSVTRPNRKMFLDLSGRHLCRPSHCVDPKNVPGPVRAAPRSQSPRRSARMTHLCSVRVTHTKNTICPRARERAAISSTPKACVLPFRDPRRRRVRCSACGRTSCADQNASAGEAGSQHDLPGGKNSAS